MRKLLIFDSLLIGWLFIGNPAWGASSDLVLKTRTIVWQAGISTQLITQLNQAALAGKPVPAFVNFNDSLSLTNHQQLQASGVGLEDYLGGDAYSALLPSATFLTNAPIVGLIFAAEHWLPSDKIQVPTTTNQLPTWAYSPQSNTVKLLVGFWRTIDRDTITNDLASVGLTGVRYGADNSWAVIAPMQTLTNLAALLSVKVIHVGPLPFFPLNNEGRNSTRTGDAQGFTYSGSSPSSSNPSYAKVSGKDVRIAICDGGIYESHNDFKLIGATSSRFYHSAPAGTPISDHATHVASVALGNGYDSRTHAFRYRGHAPQALIGNYYTNFGQFVAVGGSADDFYKILSIDGSDVSNHSYAQSWTVYDSLAASLDNIVRGTGANSSGNLIPARPSVWGAGNNGFTPGYDNEEGYYSVFTSAKNTISVGSVDTRYRPNERLSRFSSLGPTFDGRIKPDVVAPGSRNSVGTDQIMAAMSPPATPSYSGMSGTSIAAPAVTGIIALMMHQYTQTFGLLPNSSNPPKLHPATYKAILIHTARDLIKIARWPAVAGAEEDWDNPDTSASVLYYEGPDFATGYGLVDAEGARAKIAESSHWSQEVIATKGSSQTWCIAVPSGAAELKAVIAWDDLPGAVNPTPDTAPKLVNDLDLVLKAPDGTLHLPWTLAPLPITLNVGSGDPDPITSSHVVAASRAADHLNNVEMVTVPSPAAGVWHATITGHMLPFPNAQSFGLVSSHPLSQVCLSGPQLDERDIRNVFLQLREHYICIPKLQPARSLFRKGYLRFPSACPVPVNEICKYVINCPGCGPGPAWQLCPAFQISIKGLPNRAEVFIFNERGEILARDSGRQGTRILTVPEQPPDGRQFVLVIPKAGADPLGDLKLKFEFHH